jgi:hypothetical protein
MAICSGSPDHRERRAMSANDVLTVGFPIDDGSTLLDFAGATQITE